MTEQPPYEGLSDAQLAEEIKRAKLKATQASIADKEGASIPLSELIAEKVRRGGPQRRAIWMRRKMHEAAEKAEESGVGTEGKGMPTQDNSD